MLVRHQQPECSKKSEAATVEVVWVRTNQQLYSSTHRPEDPQSCTMPLVFQFPLDKFYCSWRNIWFTRLEHFNKKPSRFQVFSLSTALNHEKETSIFVKKTSFLKIGTLNSCLYISARSAGTALTYSEDRCEMFGGQKFNYALPNNDFAMNSQSQYSTKINHRFSGCVKNIAKGTTDPRIEFCLPKKLL